MQNKRESFRYVFFKAGIVEESMWEKAQTILKLLFNIHMEILDKLIGTIRK